MSRNVPELTTTSYALLGLLAIRPWSTYELARQMQRDLRFCWPRTESNLYAEPKKLIAHGLASASSEPRGKRRRTVYSITAAGRQALASLGLCRRDRGTNGRFVVHGFNSFLQKATKETKAAETSDSSLPSVKMPGLENARRKEARSGVFRVSSVPLVHFFAPISS